MCNGLEINRDEETVTKIDSNPRSRAPVYEPISLQNEADYFLPSAASKNDGTSQFVERSLNEITKTFKTWLKGMLLIFLTPLFVKFSHILRKRLT